MKYNLRSNLKCSDRAMIKNIMAKYSSKHNHPFHCLYCSMCTFLDKFVDKYPDLIIGDVVYGDD